MSGVHEKRIQSSTSFTQPESQLSIGRNWSQNGFTWEAMEWTGSLLPDTGAEIDAIPQDEYPNHFSQIPLRAAGMSETAVRTYNVAEGKFIAHLTWRDDKGTLKSSQTEVHVSHGLEQPLLSKENQKRHVAQGLPPQPGQPVVAVTMSKCDLKRPTRPAGSNNSVIRSTW